MRPWKPSHGEVSILRVKRLDSSAGIATTRSERCRVPVLIQMPAGHYPLDIERYGYSIHELQQAAKSLKAMYISDEGQQIGNASRADHAHT
jgi:hypothetical protein